MIDIGKILVLYHGKNFLYRDFAPWYDERKGKRDGEDTVPCEP